MKKLSILVVLAALVVAPSLLGQAVKMSVNGNYHGNNWTYGSSTVATGFYDGSINGVQVGPGQAGGPGMICDDFKDNVYAGEKWTATGMQAAKLNSSNIGQTLFGNLIGIKGYTEVAFLVNQMFTTNPNSTMQSAYSQAIWALTGGVDPTKLSTQALILYGAAKIMWAAGKINLQQFANLWIYTPNPHSTPGTTNQAQEMWGVVPVPEGGTALSYLFLAAIACFAGMRFRNRQPRSTAV